MLLVESPERLLQQLDGFVMNLVLFSLNVESFTGVSCKGAPLPARAPPLSLSVRKWFNYPLTDISSVPAFKPIYS